MLIYDHINEAQELRKTFEKGCHVYILTVLTQIYSTNFAENRNIFINSYICIRIIMIILITK